MSESSPLDAIRGAYEGPRAAEWVLGLITTGLLASDITSRMSSEGVQTANSYYFSSGIVQVFQRVGSGIDFAIIGILTAWLIWPRWKKTLSLSLGLVVSLGAPLIWLELIYALSELRNRIFLLNELPFRPINNYGLLGSTVFLLYVVSTMRFGRKMVWDVLVKLAIAVIVTVGQLVAYNALRGRMHV